MNLSMTEDEEFNMELKMKGTTIFADTFTPLYKDLQTCPHIIMSSSHEWNPHSVQFHSQARQFEDEMTQRYQISALQQAEFDDFDTNEKHIFNIGDFDNRVINSVKANNYSQISSLSRDDEVISHNTKTKVIGKSTKTKNEQVTFADQPLS